MGYQYRIRSLKHKEFCSVEHLAEITEVISKLKQEISPEKAEEELNSKDLTYKKTKKGLIVTYSAVSTEDGYFLHHISMSRLGDPLSLRSAAFISTYIISSLGVESWDETLQISKKGFVHFAFPLLEKEHERLMNDPLKKIEVNRALTKRSQKVKAKKLKPSNK